MNHNLNEFDSREHKAKEADNVYSVKEPYVNPPRRGIAFKRNLRSSIKGSRTTKLRSFQTDTGTNTSYNQTMTTTLFQAAHDEADSSAAVGYQASIDQAQGTAFQRLGKIGNDNDQCCVGTLHLYDPSSTTFVKHFLSNVQNYHNENYSTQEFVAGYFNTTTALTRVQFKFASGNMDTGTIKMYGVV